MSLADDVRDAVDVSEAGLELGAAIVAALASVFGIDTVEQMLAKQREAARKAADLAEDLKFGPVKP